jgi:hypothetical protein
MRYDLAVLDEFCRDIGLTAQMADSVSLHVLLGDGAVLCFQNAERDEDCLIGFLDCPWHFHGDDLEFDDHHGHFVVLDLLNLLSGLCSGEVLICEREVSGKLADRWLVHKVYNDELEYLKPGERLIVRRAGCAGIENPDQ